MYPTVNFEERALEGPTADPAVFQNVYQNIVGSDWQGFLDTLSHWWNIYSLIALLLSLIFFMIFVYAKIRYNELSAIEQAELLEAEQEWAERYGGETIKNNRWNSIQKHSKEHSPHAWKIAIIEADIFLEEILTNAGYVGATIGDKLKTANSNSFTTVQDAWEAHKVRNMIAHEGGDFILTQKIAQDTLLRFERVFREFKAI